MSLRGHRGRAEGPKRPAMSYFLWAFLFALGSAGAWRVWLQALPRPDLLDLAGDNPTVVVHIRRLSQALGRFRRFDKDGLLQGPQSALSAALDKAAGGAAGLELVKGFARDEALIALYPDGHILVLSRRGLREDLADFFARRFRWSGKAPGGSNVFKLPDGRAVYYALGRGLVLASTDEARLRKSVESGAPRASPLKSAALGMDGDFHFRILASDQQRLVPSLGNFGALLFVEGRSRSPLRPKMRWTARANWRKENPALVGLPALRGAPVWSLIPGTSLAAFEVSLPRVLEAFAGGALGGLKKNPRPENLPPGWESLKEAETAVALLSIDHAGMIPMPQLAIFSTGGASLFSDDALESLDKSMARISHGHLKMEDKKLRGIPIRVVDFPYTDTLGPALARFQGFQVAASSEKTLDRVLSAGLGFEPAIPPARYECFSVPAQARILAHLGSLSREALALIHGLRVSGFLSEKAAATWDQDARPWLLGARNLGPFAASFQLDGLGFLAEGEILGP